MMSDPNATPTTFETTATWSKEAILTLVGVLVAILLFVLGLFSAKLKRCLCRPFQFLTRSRDPNTPPQQSDIENQIHNAGHNSGVLMEENEERQELMGFELQELKGGQAHESTDGQPIELMNEERHELMGWEPNELTDGSMDENGDMGLCELPSTRNLGLDE